MHECVNVSPVHAGGPFFNLFNLGKTEAEMNKLKLNEIKNGRLAMLAMFGYGAQATITSEGPFKNLVVSVVSHHLTCTVWPKTSHWHDLFTNRTYARG